MSYTFDYYNGNVGDREIYETREKAIRAAEAYWYHLTEKEKAAHGSVHGGWCMVYEGDDDRAVVWSKDPDTDESPEAEDRIIIELGDNIVALTVPEIEDDDVWKAIEEYDAAHGTDLWDALDDSTVLGVNLPEYSAVPEYEIADTRYTGARARRIVKESRNTEQWDNDGEDDTRWYAVQKGVTSDGWPMTIRYAFPIGFEPENDKDCWSHILDVVVVGPAESEGPEEVSADIKVSAYGNSLVLRITDQARILGVDRGDVVSVTIRRK